VPVQSDFIHFKILPSRNLNPTVYYLLQYPANSVVATSLGTYSSLSAALTAAGAVSLPTDQVASLVQTNPVTGATSAGTPPGGVPEGGVTPGGPIPNPPNPVSTS
jgi:hypothetical protein